MTRGIARLFVLGFALSASQIAFCQTFGAISGETRDSTGAIISEATVTALNVATNAVRTVNTNDAGGYSFPSLPPGTYTLKVEKTGFKTIVRPQIELQVQDAARIDFEMAIGQVTESIEAQAGAMLLSTANATAGTVIQKRRIFA